MKLSTLESFQHAQVGPIWVGKTKNSSFLSTAQSRSQERSHCTFGLIFFPQPDFGRRPQTSVNLDMSTWTCQFRFGPEDFATCGRFLSKKLQTTSATSPCLVSVPLDPLRASTLSQLLLHLLWWSTPLAMIWLRNLGRLNFFFYFNCFLVSRAKTQKFPMLKPHPSLLDPRFTPQFILSCFWSCLTFLCLPV